MGFHDENKQGSPYDGFKGSRACTTRDCHGCHHRWEVRLRHDSEAETSTPGNKSVVEGPSARLQDLKSNPLSSVCRSTSPAISPSHGKVDPWWRRRHTLLHDEAVKLPPYLVKSSTLKDGSHLLRFSLYLAATPLKVESCLAEHKGLRERSSPNTQSRERTGG